MTDEVNLVSSRDQLSAIAGVSDALDRAGIDYWLFGGWAVDFWVGRVTREHGDVDVVAWRRDYDAIRAALVAEGWRHTPPPDAVVGTEYRHRSALVEFTFVDTDEQSRIVVPMADGPIVWSTEPFGDARRELYGVTARTIPLALLRAGKAHPRDDEAHAAKDHADFTALENL
jgi:hypothetical protein